MGHRKGMIRLERKILQAAALGSVKLVRSLLHSHAKPSGKEERKSLKRRRPDDHKSVDRESRKANKRARKAERTERKEHRKNFRRRRDQDRKEVEGCTSDEESVHIDIIEEEIRHSKRRRREEAEEAVNGTHRVSSSHGGQTKDDHSSSSNDRGSSGMESNDGSCTESETEISPRRAGRKHAASGETVRSVVNCRDPEGLSPLHHACHAGSENLVQFLISKGASVHARDSRGDTPLHLAAKLGPASLVTILKDAGADLEAFNDQSVTPSDILGKKEAVARRAETFKNQKNWYIHLAEELRDHEDPWWEGDWGESERPDWEDPILESMADTMQGKGLYNEPFSLRDFLKAEKNKARSEQAKNSKRKKRHAEVNNRFLPEEVVIGPTLKVAVRTDSYRKRWKTFSESYNLCLSYSSVPFPIEEGKEDTLNEVLLQGINPSMHRATLREEMLKWHPDKFLQKWGAKLQGPDHDRIVARVNAISEAIHQLYKGLTPAK